MDDTDRAAEFVEILNSIGIKDIKDIPEIPNTAQEHIEVWVIK